MESIARLSPRVLRILGQNPGKFTLQGTNTYLIGDKAPFVLLDTGEGNEAYIPHLENALVHWLPALPENNKTTAIDNHPLVSDIIISHRHHDHHGGLTSVLSLLYELATKRDIEMGNILATKEYKPPRIHKLPSPSTQLGRLTFAAEKEGGTFESTLEAISRLPSEYFQHEPRSISSSPRPLVHPLHDGQILLTSSGNTSLQVVHTPGHTTDSICLAIAEDGAIFTADTILGEGTAVFEDLVAYMNSLQVLASTAMNFRAGDGPSSPTSDSNNERKVRLYPGHGPVLGDGEATIQTYISHRNEREQQILSLIPREGDSSHKTGLTIEAVVRTLYAEYPPAIWPAAGRGVLLHLIRLEEDGKVHALPRGAEAAEVDDVVTLFAEQAWVRTE